MGKRKIYILLQEFDSTIGSIFKLLKKSNYNHASIGISDSFDEFYSFRTKWGLCIEHPFDFTKSHKREIKCIIYEIEVDEKTYENVKKHIDSFLNRKHNYYYSYFSFILGFIGLKHKLKEGYYCSRFVAEILDGSNVITFYKDASLYMPSDFMKHNLKKHFEGKAKDFNQQLVLA